MRSIVIVGAGELGGALARQLAAADIAGRVILVDEAASAAEGKALDIRQAAPIDGYTTAVTGSGDESAVIGASAILVADRHGAGGGEWHGDQGLALVRRLSYLNQEALLICAGAGQMSMVERGVRELGIPRRRLIGSAPEALRAAVVSMTALEAGCTPSEISLSVIGRPPSQIIVPWDEAAITGRRAAGVLGPPAITRLDDRLPRLWPPGPLTLAAAASRLLTAAARRRPEALSVFVAVSRDEGGSGLAGMVPVLLDRQGVVRVLMPSLSARDRVRFEGALHQ